jgi:hypothetical protein
MIEEMAAFGADLLKVFLEALAALPHIAHFRRGSGLGA